VNELQQVIHEKSKEANRLRDSFNTIRTTHDDLRKQVSSLLLNNQGCDTPPPVSTSLGISIQFRRVNFENI
jgi:hypothetical protein